ncbi:DUF6585 family protein [Sandaracinus amylolyticus]|uniref:Uncharacterized protein n=1 Tax=Sandaracinus amylolyticus TaxID=927083 RepID=A0A0F6W0K3_9BACT|nr:DUF6585 family protein [Sandaracinus amylolyticus]AKF04171.1 hypothetical protein DB32_001320 [Sandaracinus amylolyticus]
MGHDSSPYRRAAPPEAREEVDLGARLGEHRARRDVGSLVVAIALPVIAGLAALRLRVPLRTMPIAILVGCVLGLGFFAIVQLARRRPHVAVHERGIVITLRRVAHAIAWEDVDRLVIGPESRALPLGAAIIGQPNARFTTHDGRSFELRTDEVQDLDGLASLLELRCSDPLVPDAREALEAGETLDFGALRMRDDHVEVDLARAPWSEIDEAVTHLDRVELMRGGRVWRSVRFEHLVHRRVALAMLARRTRVRDGVRMLFS